MAGNRKDDKERSAYEVRRKKMIGAVAIVLAILFLIWTIAGSMMFSFADEAKAVSGADVKAQYADSGSVMRGIWVSTVGSMDYPRDPTTSAESLKAQADAVIDDCYKLGMNTIFLQVRPAADAFYKSSYYPWSRYLTGVQGQAPADGFDPLAYWVQKAHEKGIELHAWINPYRITTSASDWAKLSDDNPAKAAYSD